MILMKAQIKKGTGNYFKFIPDNMVINTALTTVGFAVFIAFQIKYSKQCRTASGCAKIYFPVSAIAYFVFALLGLIFYLVFGLFWYTWPFVITKFLHFIGLPNVLSVLIFHIINIGVISACGIQRKPEVSDE